MNWIMKVIRVILKNLKKIFINWESIQLTERDLLFIYADRISQFKDWNSEHVYMMIIITQSNLILFYFYMFS
jgi:hypothetical protein